MKLEVEDIRRAIAEKRLTAVTIDSSIVDGLRRALEHGVLKRIAQFRDSSIQVLLSDVVKRELESHVLSDAREAVLAFDKGLRQLGTAWQTPPARRAQARADLLGGDSSEAIAIARVENWLASAGAQILHSEDHASIAELLHRYFEHRPPFGEHSKKKNEFPDALALLSLEAWAEKANTLVLAVTKDGDWARYCHNSPRLVAIDDLATALGCFQDEEASYVCRLIVERTRKDDGIGLLAAIEEALSVQDWKVEFDVQADSHMRFDEDTVEAKFEVVDLGGLESDGDVEPITYEGGELVVNLSVEVRAAVTGHFSFEKWESIDREYLPMGSGSSTISERLMLDAVVTFGGPLHDRPEIVEVEIQPQRTSIDFGEIEPDWMHDPGNFDP